RIAARIAKSETYGLRVGAGIVQQRTVHNTRHLGEARFRAVRISHQIGERTRTYAIPDPSVVISTAIINAGRFSRLSRRDARYLPASEYRSPPVFCMLENRQIVDVANGEDMTLIIVGTGAIGIQIVGIDKCGIVPIGGIVNRVAVSVRERELQSTRIPPA